MSDVVDELKGTDFHKFFPEEIFDLICDYDGNDFAHCEKCMSDVLLVTGFSESELKPAAAYCDLVSFAGSGALDYGSFQDAYSGEERCGGDFARRIVEDCGYIPQDMPVWISKHINYDAVWDELNADYIENDGFFFNRANL